MQPTLAHNHAAPTPALAPFAPAATAPAPTGRPRLTPAQVTAEASRPITFPPTTPGRALAAFKRAKPALGVADKVVTLIDLLVGHTQAQDWEGGPGLGPIAWPSDAWLEDRLEVGPTQRKATVRAALDAGFMRLRRSPNGKRWGHRDKQGRITDAYGFDLAPLAERAAEFERTAAEWEARRAEGRRLRREITCSRNDVLSRVDLAVMQGLEGEDWPAAAVQAGALWRERGDHRDPLALVPIAARLRALCIHVGERVAAALAAVEAVKAGETDPMGAENRPQHTTTNQLPTAKADTSAAGPDRPLAQGKRGSRGRADPRETPGQGPAGQGGSALRGFVVKPEFLLRIAPAFRDQVRTSRPDWADMLDAAGLVRVELGVSLHAWGQACVVLGRVEAVTVLAAISARHAAGEVRSPGGLLRRMVQLHQAGELHLDRTLFGLDGKANGGPRAARSEPTPRRDERDRAGR